MQTEMPLVTTYIPTYRRPHLLRRAIRSVLAQTYPHLRVCVYDDASGDETAAVVDELARHDPRIEYHCHAENIGMVPNFAYILTHVDTPFFSILPDDDYYLPAFFETAMTGFDTHPDAVCSGGATVIVTERGDVVQSASAEGYVVPPDGLRELIDGKYPGFESFIYRAEVGERVGALDPTIFHWDVDFLFRVLPRFPHVVSRRPCVIKIFHDQQSTRHAEIAVRLQSYQSLRDRLRGNALLSPDIRVHAEEVLSAVFSRSMFIAGLLALCQRDIASAREAVAALRKPFAAKRDAAVLSLLLTGCQKSRLFHLVFTTFFTFLYPRVLRFYSRKYRAVREQIEPYLPVSYLA